jgi:hypothetical protein
MSTCKNQEIDMPPVGTRNDPTKLLPLPKENKTPSPANLDGSKVRKRSATGAASTASSRPRSNVKANVKGFVNKLVEKKTAWEKKKAEKKAEKKAAKHAEARGDVRASTKRGKEPSLMPHDDEAANVPTAAEPRRAESDLGSFFEAAWRALETEPEKSSLGTPTERTDHLSVMSHAKAVNVLSNARISKR